MKKVLFTAHLSPTIKDFDCGPEPWAVEVSDYVKAADVLYDMNKYGNKVWLYYNEDDQQVGYASLGLTAWRHPGEKDPKKKIHIIPYFGIRKEFQGKPFGPRENRYSTLILQDLIFEACVQQKSAGNEVHPFLGLFVDTRNTRAISFYEWFGFRVFLHTSKGREKGITNQSMILMLPPEMCAAPLH